MSATVVAFVPRSAQDDFRDRLASCPAVTPLEPQRWAIRRGDSYLLRAVASKLLDDGRLLIDNDHDRTGSGSKFVQTLRARPFWDWRRRLISPN